MSKDIPEHEHTHSLYVHCLECHTFGINLPTRFIDAAECGNCKSIQTVKYYPSCCIVADREALAAELELSKLTVLAVSKNNLAISAENEKLKTDKIRLMRDMGIHVSNIEKLRTANAELVEALKAFESAYNFSLSQADISALLKQAISLMKKALAEHGGGGE